MIIELDGSTITSEHDFHKKISTALSISEFYGSNLNALWDLLSTDIERPVKLIWNDSDLSEKMMGDSYKKIINILERVKKQDESFGWSERFTYQLK